MKTRNMNFFLILALLSICTLKVNAQNNAPELTVVLNGGEKNDEVVKVFIENAPNTFQAPSVPRFAIMGKQHKFYLGIGGYAKTTLSYDFGHPINNGWGFITSDIPINMPKGNGGLVQLNAQQSALFANFVALPGTDNQLGAYVNAHFFGANYGLDLVYAYLKYRGWTVGYNTSLFTNEEAAPSTIDFEGPSGYAYITNAVAQFKYKINDRWSVAIAAEMPILSATTNSKTYAVNQRIPDIPAYVQYNWCQGNSSVRLGGLMRNLLYRDEVADKNKNIIGWGAQLSGKIQVTKKLSMVYQGVYGKGITNYLQDVQGFGLDIIPYENHLGELTAVASWGAYAGLQYNFTKNTFASVTYSQMRNYADEYSGGSTSWDTQYRYGQYLVANVFWNINPTLQMGVEYLWGKRSNMNKMEADNNRIQAMMQINF